MKSCVVFDLDSTLANTSHRQWMIPAIYEGGEGAPTWDDYSMACPDDAPIESTIWLANLCHATNHEVIIVTGRSSGARELTIDWLKRHDVYFSKLIMRPEGDRTPNPIFKLAALDHLKEMGYCVELFVDDYAEVLTTINHHYPRIRTLQVNPGYHGTAGA